jgi:hypothetical protein
MVYSSYYQQGTPRTKENIMSNVTNSQTEESLKVLRELLPVGTVVRTILRKVSSSGMSRQISVVVVDKDGNIRDITWHVSQVAGFKLADSRDFALKVGGVGMDMGFHVVYALSRALYPHGHMCTGSNGRTPAGNKSKTRLACPSNDHSNDYGDLTRVFDKKFPEVAAVINARYSSEARPTQDELEAAVAQRQTWVSEQKTYTKTRAHSDGGYALRQQWL